MRVSVLCLLLLWCSAAQAVTIETKLADPAQEQVAQSVIRQLNCVVCEGQALADSDATFAREMRREIRRMAGEGETEETIRNYFRERYGASILLTPPMEATTLPLWLAPFAMLFLGGMFLWRWRRKV